jgi:hypothetical protein
MAERKRDLAPSDGLTLTKGGQGRMQADKFTALEVAELRSELLQATLDPHGTAEVIQTFLAGRGYGVSVEAVRAAAFTVESSGCSLAVMQRELNRIAMVQ